MPMDMRYLIHICINIAQKESWPHRVMTNALNQGLDLDKIDIKVYSMSEKKLKEVNDLKSAYDSEIIRLNNEIVAVDEPEKAA